MFLVVMPALSQFPTNWESEGHGEVFMHMAEEQGHGPFIPSPINRGEIVCFDA